MREVLKFTAFVFAIGTTLGAPPAPKPASGPIKAVTEAFVWRGTTGDDLVRVVESTKTVTITGPGFAEGWRCQEPTPPLPPSSSTETLRIYPNTFQ